jgi:hypothetical protein
MLFCVANVCSLKKLAIISFLYRTRIGTVRILPDVVIPAYPRNALAECARSSHLVTNHLQASRKLKFSSRKKVSFHSGILSVVLKCDFTEIVFSLMHVVQIVPSCSAWSCWVYELYNPVSGISDFA